MKLQLVFTGLLAASVTIMIACNSNDKATTDQTTDNTATTTSTDASNPKGIGPVSKVELTHPLDEKMVASGKSVYEVKCASCHKITDEKLVGPGWKGVTDRRTPEWIMNFAMNPEEMLEKDTAAQNMLEVCLVKMPNQNLAEADSRAVLEFMRKNDGKN
jgi:cytochrome c551/c552